MPDLSVTIVLPAGGARTAEVPDDVPVRELLPELVSALELPTTGPDGRPMGYRLDSKALGRELRESETLAEAQVPANDRLMITADVTAGARSLVTETPRFRRLKADYERMLELKAHSDLIDFEVVDPKPGFPPEKYIVTFRCKSIIGVDLFGKPRFGDKHQVAIYLHNEYPHRWPGLKWLTPIWHPNIKGANGSVCIDAAWWTAARSLDRLVIMLGEMAEWKNYHDDPTKPPFPWDAEAARWSRSYRMTHPGCFPVDTRELLRPERVKLAEPAAKTSGAASKIKWADSSPKTTHAAPDAKPRPKIKLK
jgi:ubiquitin-protein ligase